MNIEIIDPETVWDNWSWMGQILAPAIAHDDDRTDLSVRKELAEGFLTAWIVTSDAYTGLMVTKMDAIAWVIYCAGKFEGGPKKVRASIREIMTGFEGAARRGHAKEMRFSGRKKWECVFPDYEFDGTVFRKVL